MRVRRIDIIHLIRAGHVQASKLGRNYQITGDSLLQYLEMRE